jgi:demethylmenaquinone methyltransferase / 2-methoxy-6-polyprenyl-1,4-benzoquinol methylase
MSKHQGPPAQEIQKIFTSVAHGYDRANSFITLGMINGWRRKLVKMSGAQAGQSVLDCATGTGDLAIEFQRAVGPKGIVIGTDFNEAMLALAPAKARKYDLPISFQQADVTNLPFDDGRFDISSIGYGIRNVENPIKGLSEMARVTKPGGFVMVIETGDSQWPGMTVAFDFYFKRIVPKLGGLATGRPEAYEYLNKSSKKFPSRDGFLSLMKETGRFSKLEFKALLGGASFIYKGTVA